MPGRPVTEPSLPGEAASASSAPGSPPPSPGSPPPATAPTGLRRASALLASGTLVSRGLGFVSALVLAWVIGTQFPAADAFALANQLPNNIYAIIAGGLLSAVLVPQVVKAALHADGGQGFVNRLITLGVVVFAAVALIATLCAPLLVHLYARPDGSLDQGGLALATAFAYWCLPQIFFYAVYSLLGEVLNARGVFGPFTWAPVINNVVAIAGMLVFAALFGTDPSHRDPSTWNPESIALLAGTASLGVAAQAAVLVAFWRRTGLGFRPDFRWRGVGLGATARAAGWTFGMVLVTQLAGIVQSNVASTAGVGDPSLAVLRFAWLIFMLPHSIITVSIATPYFTRMATHARDADLAAVRDDLSASLRTIGMLMVGSAVALAAASVPFAALFNRESAVSLALVLLAYLIGLVPFSVLFLLQRTFYALENTRTPFFVQLVQSALFVVGAVAVGVLAPVEWKAGGIAVITSVAGIVQSAVAAALLRRRLGSLDGRRVLRRFGVFALAALPAGAVGVVVFAALGGFTAHGFVTAGFLPAALSLAAIGAVTLGAYLAVLWVVRVPELRGALTPILGRLRRR